MNFLGVNRLGQGGDHPTKNAWRFIDLYKAFSFRHHRDTWPADTSLHADATF
jgi:hypothetical protein